MGKGRSPLSALERGFSGPGAAGVQQRNGAGAGVGVFRAGAGRRPAAPLRWPRRPGFPGWGRRRAVRRDTLAGGGGDGRHCLLGCRCRVSRGRLGSGHKRCSWWGRRVAGRCRVAAGGPAVQWVVRLTIAMLTAPGWSGGSGCPARGMVAWSVSQPYGRRWYAGAYSLMKFGDLPARLPGVWFRRAPGANSAHAGGFLPDGWTDAPRVWWRPLWPFIDCVSNSGQRQSGAGRLRFDADKWRCYRPGWPPLAETNGFHTRLRIG